MVGVVGVVGVGDALVVYGSHGIRIHFTGWLPCQAAHGYYTTALTSTQMQNKRCKAPCSQNQSSSAHLQGRVRPVVVLPPAHVYRRAEAAVGQGSLDRER